jgi:hypothetical protein
MQSVVAGKHDGAGKLAPGMWLAGLIAVVSASSAASISGIVVKLSWPESLMLGLTAAAMAVGVAFTILEMRSLAAKKR